MIFKVQHGSLLHFGAHMCSDACLLPSLMGKMSAGQFLNLQPAVVMMSQLLLSENANEEFCALNFLAASAAVCSVAKVSWIACSTNMHVTAWTN